LNRTCRVLAALALAVVSWTWAVASPVAAASSASQPLASVPNEAPNPAASSYFPVTPARILDTRSGTGGVMGPLGVHVAVTFQVTGRGQVSAGATAVTGNLTVTAQTSKGYLYIGPDAANSPPTSTLNFPAGDDRANGVTVALNTYGQLSVTFVAPTYGPTAQAIFDVTGYFMPGTGGASFHPLTPARILDTRYTSGGITNKLATHKARPMTVYGMGGVPSNATAVTGNLTATNQTSNGYLYIGPVPTDYPTSSTVNFPLGDTRANGVTVQLGSGGILGITFVSPTTGQSCDVIFDVTGYFTADTTGSWYHALTPVRLLDSRSGNGFGGTIQMGDLRMVQIATRGGVPWYATGVTGNLTVTTQTSNGYLFIGPVPTYQPTTSTLNFPVGDDRANGVTVALGAAGTLSIYYGGPSTGYTTNAIFDVTGYFGPASVPAALSMAQAQADFNYIMDYSAPPGAQPNSTNLYSDYIEWNDPADGCFARTYVMLRMLNSELGVSAAALGRVWAFDNWNDAWWKTGKQNTQLPEMMIGTALGPWSWGYHVAVTVQVNVNGTVTPMVIDPMFAPSGPVTIDQWLGVMYGVVSHAQTAWGKPNPISLAGSGYWLSLATTPEPANLDLHARQTECSMFNKAIDAGLERRDSTGAEPPKVTCP
jgi:Glutaminase